VGLIGGTLGYRLLRRIAPAGEGRGSAMDGSVYATRSKLEVLLGPGVWDAIRGRTVVDFGCGDGGDAVEMVRRGAAAVVGVDIQPRMLEAARANAERAGVADRCRFVERYDGRADVIVSLDAFEHFADPAEMLRLMHGMLAPGGVVLVSFGPTWYHPLGGHLFSVFPWAHLVFTERALIRWRADFKTDGATRFGEVAGGLNQMTVRRFERLVAASPLRFAAFEAVPIRGLRRVASRATREVTTAIVRCTLTAREPRPAAS
jgi:SAM-dependent methyltransferase